MYPFSFVQYGWQRLMLSCDPRFSGLLMQNSGGTPPVCRWQWKRSSSLISHWFLLTAAETWNRDKLMFLCSVTAGGSNKPRMQPHNCHEIIGRMLWIFGWNESLKLYKHCWSMIGACSGVYTKTKGANLFWGPQFAMQKLSGWKICFRTKSSPVW